MWAKIYPHTGLAIILIATLLPGLLFTQICASKPLTGLQVSSTCCSPASADLSSRLLFRKPACEDFGHRFPSLHLALTAHHRSSKASVLPFVLPTEQLNQQEIQSHYIHLWKHFNHLKALGWKRKTFTNDVQLWCFFLSLHASFFCFRCCLNRTWNCLVKCTCEIWQPSQLNTVNGCFYYTYCVNTDMSKITSILERH